MASSSGPNRDGNLSPAATLNTKASQETFISLLQLDPQPMADDDDDGKPLPPLPEEGSGLSSTSGSWTSLMADSASTVRPGGASEHEAQHPPPSMPKHNSNPLGLSHSPIYYRESSRLLRVGEGDSCPWWHRHPMPTLPSSPCASLTLFVSTTVSRIQRVSSYTFTLFASLHLATTSLVPLTQYLLAGSATTSRLATAVAASDGALLAVREIYQAPYTEPVLVGLPILLHVGSGVAMRLLRWRQNLARYGGATPGVRALARRREREESDLLEKGAAIGGGGGGGGGEAERWRRARREIQSAWPRMSYIALAGYALLPLVAGHMFVNRIMPLERTGDSSAITLAYVSHGFARHGPGSVVGAAVWAFYLALVGVAAGHIVWGWARWLGVESVVLGTGPEGVGRRRRGLDGAGGGSSDWDGSGSRSVDPDTRRRRKRSWWSVQAATVAVAAAWAAGALGVVARAGSVQGWVGRLYDSLYDSIGL